MTSKIYKEKLTKKEKAYNELMDIFDGDDDTSTTVLCLLETKANNATIEERERIIDIIKKERSEIKFGINQTWDTGFSTALDLILKKI